MRITNGQFPTFIKSEIPAQKSDNGVDSRCPTRKFLTLQTGDHRNQNQNQRKFTLHIEGEKNINQETTKKIALTVMFTYIAHNKTKKNDSSLSHAQLEKKESVTSFWLD